MTDISPASTRLINLLHSIREGLGKSLDSLLPSDEDELPMFDLNNGDVTVAVLMLKDIGLHYDAIRLKRRFSKLVADCVGEWLAVIAKDETPERREMLSQKYGTFPSSTNPNDSTVADRRLRIIARATETLRILDELIGCVNPKVNNSPVIPVAPKINGQLDGSKKNREDLKKMITVCIAKKSDSWRALEEKYDTSERNVRRWAEIINYDLKNHEFVSPSAETSAVLAEMNKTKKDTPIKR